MLIINSIHIMNRVHHESIYNIVEIIRSLDNFNGKYEILKKSLDYVEMFRIVQNGIALELIGHNWILSLLIFLVTNVCQQYFIAIRRMSSRSSLQKSSVNPFY